MKGISFWTPIVNHENKLLNAADQLFGFGNKKAYLIKPSNNSGIVRIQEKESLKAKGIAWRIALLVTFPIPLCALIIKVYDRRSNNYKILQTSPSLKKEVDPTTSSPERQHSPAPAKPLGERVILYMSLTGNPTHLGHMAAVATAIDVLVKQGMMVRQVRISLSDESYHKGKVARAQGKKIALEQEDRVYLLNGAIEEAVKRNMFQGVQVDYWNDQDKGYSDHPDSYKRLVQEEAPSPVYLVAGADLCKAMNNWPSVENAIIVSRESSSSDILARKENHLNSSYRRLFVKSLYPEFTTISSSAIQEGNMNLEPTKLQTYFEKRKLELQGKQSLSN